MQTYRDTRDKILTQSLSGNYKSRATHRSLIFFTILGLINISLGILLTILYTNIYDIQIPYKNDQSFAFTLPKNTMELAFYLQVSNFYQSHSYYASSYSIEQLNGKATTNIDACKPLRYSEGKIIYPCGLMANAYNQDVFKLKRGDREIPIKTENISWSNAKDRIKNTTYDLSQITSPPLWQQYETVPQLQDDLRFANWMEQSSFSTFRKLYGKIDGLDAGEYTLVINKTSIFGNTSVYITEMSWIGSKNYFLSVIMIVIGILLIVASFFCAKF